MAKLKALGVKTPADTGDLSELIGIKAVIKQLTYNEAKGRPKKDSEKVFWLPIEIIPTAALEGEDGAKGTRQKDTKPSESERESVVPPLVLLTLEEDIQHAADSLSEAGLIEWYEKSRHYDGKTVVPLFMAITKMLEQGAMIEKDGVYKVGISEPIANVAEKALIDDLGEIEEEKKSSHSSS
jgi:hypothetical protein